MLYALFCWIILHFLSYQLPYISLLGYQQLAYLSDYIFFLTLVFSIYSPFSALFHLYHAFLLLEPSCIISIFLQVLDPESLYFRDGKRKIDMILVYEEEELGVMTEAEAKRRDNRKVFQENLVKEGLELELEHKDLSFDGKTWFLKIHLPWKTKTRYAAVMGLKLPIKRFITISVKAWVRQIFAKN